MHETSALAVLRRHRALLWALTRARAGDDADALSAQATAAGYDLGPVRQIMDALKPA